MSQTVATADKPAASLRRVIFDAWSNLWRPREVILRERYVEGARAAGVDLSQAVSLDDVRQQYFARMSATTAPSDYDRDGFEHRMVLWTRMVAAWMVWWTGCVPLACVGWLFRRQIALLPGPDWMAATVTLLGAFCAFWLFCLLGLLLQALFLRPFVAFLNWWMAKL
jgi:hypothetical protein